MKTIRNAMILPALFLMTASDSLAAGGARITVSLRDGTSLEGELLSVRDSTLIISTVENYDTGDAEGRISNLQVVAIPEVRTVTVHGKSYILQGVGIGLVAGGIGGYLIGTTVSSNESDPVSQSLARTFNPIAYGVLGAGVGLLGGLMVGAGLSTSDVQTAPSKKFGLSSLREYARFREAEPEYLREVH